MGWIAERYPQDHQQVGDHRIVDGDKVIAFCPTGYPFENVELMAMAPALLRVVRAADARRQAAREFLPLDEIRKINKEIDDALEALPEHLKEE